MVIEEAAIESVRSILPSALERRLVRIERSALAATSGRSALARLDPHAIPWLDPVAERRVIRPGHPTAEDARGALAALDLGLELVRSAVAEALVTAPVSKAAIDRWVLPGFRGHTDYLAEKLGCARYGSDYLMAFLGDDLRVALLTVHQPLREAIAAITEERVVDTLRLLHRSAPRDRSGGAPRIALAGLNPHAGEDGLLGREEIEMLSPAVARARELGVEVVGPESPDTVFLRCRRGEFDWVLALYHDQGLIAVKTLSFGCATNVTLGLPILRTSVDHGTAYALAGTGRADAAPMERVVATTLDLLARR